MWQSPTAIAALLLASFAIGGSSLTTTRDATIDAAASAPAESVSAEPSLRPTHRQIVERVIHERLDQLSDEQGEAMLEAVAAVAAGRTWPPTTEGVTSGEAAPQGAAGTLGLIALLGAMLGVGSVLVGFPMSSGSPTERRIIYRLSRTYDEREDRRATDLGGLLTWGVGGRNHVLAGLDFGLMFIAPVVVAISLVQTCSA